MDIVVRGQATVEELAAVIVSFRKQDNEGQPNSPITEWQRARRAAVAVGASRTADLERIDGASLRLRRRP
jgi:hypothetical protein